MAKDSYFIMCPFYKKDESLWVKCEGVDDENRLSLSWFALFRKEEYMNKYCKDIDGHKECRIYRMLLEKYDE